jgi:hypothetical protein
MPSAATTNRSSYIFSIPLLIAEPGLYTGYRLVGHNLLAGNMHISTSRE